MTLPRQCRIAPSIALIIIAALALGGCKKSKTTMEDPPAPLDPNPTAQPVGDVRERIMQLQARAAEYTNIAKRLPAGSEEENRRLIAQEFGLLSQMIPMLSGPDMPGELLQQTRILDATRAQLSGGSMELAAEPTIGTGLRAAERALASINRRAFSEVPEIATSLEAMAANVNNLDAASGPQHRWIAAQAFKASANAINKMGATMSQRLGDTINRPEQTPTPPPVKSGEKGPRAT